MVDYLSSVHGLSYYIFQVRSLSFIYSTVGNKSNAPFKKHLRYESYRERETMALDDQVRTNWSNSTKARDLKDVASNLDKLMKSLHSWSRIHIDYPPKNLRQPAKD